MSRRDACADVIEASNSLSRFTLAETSADAGRKDTLVPGALKRSTEATPLTTENSSTFSIASTHTSRTTPNVPVDDTALPRPLSTLKRKSRITDLRQHSPPEFDVSRPSSESKRQTIPERRQTLPGTMSHHLAQHMASLRGEDENPQCGGFNNMVFNMYQNGKIGFSRTRGDHRWDRRLPADLEEVGRRLRGTTVVRRRPPTWAGKVKRPELNVVSIVHEATSPEPDLSVSVNGRAGNEVKNNSMYELIQEIQSAAPGVYEDTEMGDAPQAENGVEGRSSDEPFEQLFDGASAWSVNEGMDNIPRAYVDGQFEEQFSNDSDAMDVDDAQPSEVEEPVSPGHIAGNADGYVARLRVSFMEPALPRPLEPQPADMDADPVMSGALPDVQEKAKGPRSSIFGKWGRQIKAKSVGALPSWPILGKRRRPAEEELEGERASKRQSELKEQEESHSLFYAEVQKVKRLTKSGLAQLTTKRMLSPPPLPHKSPRRSAHLPSGQAMDPAEPYRVPSLESHPAERNRHADQDALSILEGRRGHAVQVDETSSAFRQFAQAFQGSSLHPARDEREEAIVQAPAIRNREVPRPAPNDPESTFNFQGTYRGMNPFEGSNDKEREKRRKTTAIMESTSIMNRGRPTSKLELPFNYESGLSEWDSFTWWEHQLRDVRRLQNKPVHTDQ